MKNKSKYLHIHVTINCFHTNWSSYNNSQYFILNVFFQVRAYQPVPIIRIIPALLPIRAPTSTPKKVHQAIVKMKEAAITLAWDPGGAELLVTMYDQENPICGYVGEYLAPCTHSTPQAHHKSACIPQIIHGDMLDGHCATNDYLEGGMTCELNLCAIPTIEHEIFEEIKITISKRTSDYSPMSNHDC